MVPSLGDPYAKSFRKTWFVLRQALRSRKTKNGMLPVDSLVIDLIFQSGAELDPEKLVEAMGGNEVAETRKLLDPDMVDPRFELTMSPSMPFRQRGERRLLVIDDSVAPLRPDLETDPVCKTDLRPEKERLLALCDACDVRLGRITGFSVWGDAVWVARNAKDLRGICLISWALDPTMDVSGKRRASQLTQPEFEEKLGAYLKRLDELDENTILKNIGLANFARHGDYLVVDVLENDGTWDLRKSHAAEASIAAISSFSVLPGAPSTATSRETSQAKKPAPSSSGVEKASESAPSNGAQSSSNGTATPDLSAVTPSATPSAPPSATMSLRTTMLDGLLAVIYSEGQFDLELAAAYGKKDWDGVLRTVGGISGEQRDGVYERGAHFLAPLEFLSEVFIEGVPLSKPTFEEHAQTENGGRFLEVHYPRFGPALLVELGDKRRFVCSAVKDRGSVLSAAQS